MPNSRAATSKSFLVTVTLTPSELGLFAALRQAKRSTNDEVVSAMVAFCAQLLIAEISALAPDHPLARDLERAALKLSAHLKQLGTVLAGAEKILLDAAALRAQLAHEAKVA